MGMAHKHPRTIRAINPTGAVRLGVWGSLSATNSPSANRLNTIRAVGWPTNANLVPASFSQPRRAAQQTAAGGVIDRNPVAHPISRHNRNVYVIGSLYLNNRSDQSGQMLKAVLPKICRLISSSCCLRALLMNPDNRIS